MSEHADIVKGLHKSLRKKFQNGVSEKQLWDDLLHDQDALEAYSHSMHALAGSSWKMDNNNRIFWVENTLHHYYELHGFEKALRREYKTKLFKEMREQKIKETNEEKQRIDILIDEMNFTKPTLLFGNKLLLDVGSCYNPFKRLEDYHSIAIDIAPATGDVYKCDFLNLKISRNVCYKSIASLKSKLTGNELPACTFDVVVFSLLMSYFPSPKQRLKCCTNAYSLLQLNGLLVIITPDSSHQNKHADMMKSWKAALEQIGFTRFKYEKLDHLHCMAYRKSKDIEIKCEDYINLSESFFIPQDFQSIEEPNQTDTQADFSYDTTVFGDIDL